MAFGGFDAAFFRFFDELSRNNERGWFQEHKPEYERIVVAPLLAFIEDMGPKLGEISDQFVADPRRSGGSMFRIYRDIRFSKDKTPYKTHAAVQFRHKLGKDVHAPGFYLHVSPREFILGAGIWRPATDDLAKIRGAVQKREAEWVKARDHAPFRKRFQLHGESLKRPPKGFPADHGSIEDLKRKDFVAICNLAPPVFLERDLVDQVTENYRVTVPFVRFLCNALGVPF